MIKSFNPPHHEQKSSSQEKLLQKRCSGQDDTKKLNLICTRYPEFIH